MRIVIVEDSSPLLNGLKLVLNSEADIEVVGAFSSAEDALPALWKLQPDILIVALDLPWMPGLEFIKKAKKELPEIEVMVYTAFDDKRNILSAIKAGASGYILKSSRYRELVEGLYDLYQGGAPMSPKIARKVVMELQDDGISGQCLLSRREKDIVRNIEEGSTYKEVAEKFNLSPHTVHTHIKNIYKKLRARDRSEALRNARKKGVI